MIVCGRKTRIESGSKDIWTMKNYVLELLKRDSDGGIWYLDLSNIKLFSYEAPIFCETDRRRVLTEYQDRYKNNVMVSRKLYLNGCQNCSDAC